MIQVLPGTNVTVKAGARPAELSVTGVVTVPLDLNWGGVVAIIDKDTDTLPILGYSRSDPALKIVNEILNGADKLILYRTNTEGGTQASATLATGITAKAKYAGTRGNDITVTVAASGSKWIIKTIVGTTEVDSQTVSADFEMYSNNYITITGTGTLAAASQKLTGGVNGSIQTGTIDLYTAELQKHEYNVICYTGSDSDTITKLKAFLLDQRSRDIMIQCVMSGVAADNVAIYNSTVGGVTENYTLTPNEAAATMAGLIAKQGVTGGLTHYDQITGWTDVYPHLTNDEMKTRTLNGEILFVMLHGVPSVLYDINSLVTYTDQQPKDFNQGLLIRTQDKYTVDLKKLLDTKAIGKIRNSVDGRAQIKAMINDMTVTNYLNNGYIEGFTADDITVLAGAESDAVTAKVDVKFVNTVNKITVTVTAL